MKIQDYAAEVERTVKPGDIWACLRAAFAEHGISKIGYRHLPPIGAPDADVLRFQLDGYREDLVDRFVKERLYEEEYIMKHARTNSEPYYWSEVQRDSAPTEREKTFEALLAEAGVEQGLGLPVFGPNGRNGFFAIGFPPGIERVEQETVKEFQWICQLAHIRYCTMVMEDLGPCPELSKREREILAWVARGKSNATIGDILGISSHTVDTHLRRIYLKLDVFDRITATVRGMGIGLISSQRA